MYQDATRFTSRLPAKPIIGMVHLKALPGSPMYGGRMQPIVEAALRDADALQRGGIDAIMVENFFDTPFFKDRVGPETVAAMTHILTLIRARVDVPLGVNVLRNDGISALAVAAAVGAAFVRINILSWAMLADQGLIEGRAAEVLRYRRSLGVDPLIFADCLTKHAAPIAPQTMEIVAMDTWERGGADALVISGVGTGKPTDYNDVAAARRGAPHAPILLGSGVTPETLPTFLPIIDGAIVGTYFKAEGKVENPVEASRVQQLMAAKKALHHA
jgi:membrane complex biogenesis BtpA family protein